MANPLDTQTIINRANMLNTPRAFLSVAAAQVCNDAIACALALDAACARIAALEEVLQSLAVLRDYGVPDDYDLLWDWTNGQQTGLPAGTIRRARALMEGR